MGKAGRKSVVKTHSWTDIQDKAVAFAADWRGTTYERGESQSFWTAFLDIFGVDRRRHGALFEDPVKKRSGSTGFVDLFWPGRLLVEQKSGGKDLDKAQKQAYEYLLTLPDHDLPKAVVVSNFERFRFINQITREETEFDLKDLPENVQLFGCLIDKTSQKTVKQDPVNRKAAESMALLHNQLKDDNYIGRDLELLLVRLVFLMFAEDSGVFDRGVLLNYITNQTADDGSGLGSCLIQIFQVLDMPENKRQASLLAEAEAEAISSLPYVNGALFSESIHIPSFNRTMRDALIKAMKLDWSNISPAIFGSMFQGVMDKNERRNLGAHYTSEANILKVIKPLFLDNLYVEFSLALRAGPRKKFNELSKLQNKIANLKFLDPACGCGNFLVITYRELRQLEHKIVDVLSKSSTQSAMFVGSHVSPLKVNVDQMYGIEIEEFPSLIAQTALWLTDHQMNLEYSKQVAHVFKRIPLTRSATIVNTNALTKNWDEIVDPKELDYILGNPPFNGSRKMSTSQKSDLLGVVGDIKEAGFLDLVAGWYFKAAEVMQHNPNIKSALVSTNSITQGEQVNILWQPLFDKGISIDFAHQTFKWSNDAKSNAAVYCVIIGFSLRPTSNKFIFEYADVRNEGVKVSVKNINPYLIDSSNTIVCTQRSPLSETPEMNLGNMPADKGNLIISEKERDDITAQYPNAKHYIYELIGAKELIQGGTRYCLWLTTIPPDELRAIPPFLERVEKNRAVRLVSARPELADAAALFAQITADPNTYKTAIVIPRVSSEKRDYIPIVFVDNRSVVADSCLVISGASLYHFGILTSRMHMAWMRTVAGRYKSDYRYSKNIVYNNFVWPEAGTAQKDEVTKLAQAVLDARAEYPEATLADLYDPTAMPITLRKAHNKLDRAVDRLYGLPLGILDNQRVAHLFGLYTAVKHT